MLKKGLVAKGIPEPSSKLIAWKFRPELQNIKVYKSEGVGETTFSTIRIIVPSILGRSSDKIKVRIVNSQDKNKIYYAEDVKATEFTTSSRKIYLNKDTDTKEYILLSDILSFLSITYEDGEGAKIDPITQVVTVWVPE